MNRLHLDQKFEPYNNYIKGATLEALNRFDFPAGLSAEVRPINAPRPAQA